MAIRSECLEILPSPGEVSELTLPFTYFDIPWLYFHPIQRLLFYESHFSKDHFLETVVPNLKQSLSLTLKHYIPLAGNILHPSNGEKSVLRYLVGDSVSLYIAESDDDFHDITANHARDADKFYPFVPQLPPPKVETDYELFPVFGVQVTLFPNHGLCIGFANHHSLGDASSIVGFIKAWASINKLEGDSHLVEAKSLPLFDKSIIKDPHGIADIYWKKLKHYKAKYTSLHLPTNKVRATFILHRADILKLKESLLAKNPALGHLSSFVVTTAFVWTCLVKSGLACGEKVDADELEYFVFAVDCRARMDPPVPSNYFGNCLLGVVLNKKHKELIETDGFFTAAEAIAEIIKEKVNKKGEIIKEAGKLLAIFGEVMGKRVLSIAGSPKFDLYEADYGWGRPKKMEAVSIDGDESISLCKSRDSEGGLEVGLSMPKAKMDAFAAIFQSGLQDLPQVSTSE